MEEERQAREAAAKRAAQDAVEQQRRARVRVPPGLNTAPQNKGLEGPHSGLHRAGPLHWPHVAAFASSTPLDWQAALDTDQQSITTQAMCRMRIAQSTGQQQSS